MVSFIATVVLLGFVLGLFFFFRFYRPFSRLPLDLKLLRIELSRKEERNKEEDFKKEINFSEQLFDILASLKRPAVFEAAVRHVGEDIIFFVAVPARTAEFVSRQIQGLWSEAQVKEVDDYNIFNPHGAAAGAYLVLRQNYALPIRTYTEANVDTFAPILSNLSKLSSAGEGAAFQLMIAPAPSKTKNSVISLINQLKKGEKLSDILKIKFPFRKIGETLIGKNSDNGKEKKEERVVDERGTETLEKKISKQLFSVNARLVASAASQLEADSVIDAFGGSFSQFAAPLRNEFRIVKPRNVKKLLFKFSFREFDPSYEMILNSEETASIFHLPASSTDVPRIKWLKSKEAAPPNSLPAEGVVIGESVFRGERRLVKITDDDRRRHVYSVGQTGTGKSVLLKNMAVQDIKDGRGVCVIDPHGDSVNDILRLVPEERAGDVIVFDPGDITRPLGLNMLEYDFSRPEEKTFIAHEMQSIFNKLFLAETMGPMFEQYMRNALLLLMEDAVNELATLVEVPRVFSDENFRRRKLGRIANPVVIDFWEKEAVKAGGEAALSNMTPYITSKFNNFIANDYLRPIIGQVKSAFNFREAMDAGRIILVNLSKGRIGEINANLLGMIIVGKLLMAALSRAELPEERRRDFNLYIDEFQNFTTDSIAIILSEARKYRLNLFITHQFIAQLAEKIRDAVFGNVGSIVAFRVGVPDTELLTKQFEPVFSPNDLINIDNYSAYIKLLINNQPSRPFNIRTLPPEKGSEEVGEKIKELSRLTYGRDRREVEAEILRRLRE